MRTLFGRRLLAVTLLAMPVDAHLGNAAEITLDLAIKDWQLPKAMRTIKVQEGDAVRLRLSADRSMILHLHGYDIEKRVGPSADGRDRLHSKCHRSIPPRSPQR
jgi:hypothetical protein